MSLLHSILAQVCYGIGFGIGVVIIYEVYRHTWTSIVGGASVIKSVYAQVVSRTKTKKPRVRKGV